MQGYWLKKFTFLHSHLAHAFDRILLGTAAIPEWFTNGRTTLIPKSTPPSPDPAKYRPITCLPVVYKIFTSCLGFLMWNHVNNNNILAAEQRGCSPGKKGCVEQLLVNQMICDDVKRRKRSLYSVWIDFRKAYDSVPHACMVQMLAIYKFNPAIIHFFERAMPYWQTKMHLKLQSHEIHSDIIPIRRGIFQGDSLSPLVFCLCLNPISAELRRSGMGYVLSHDTAPRTVSYLWYMDDMKIYCRTRTQLTSMTRTVQLVA